MLALWLHISNFEGSTLKIRMVLVAFLKLFGTKMQDDLMLRKFSIREERVSKWLTTVTPFSVNVANIRGDRKIIKEHY